MFVQVTHVNELNICLLYWINDAVHFNVVDSVKYIMMYTTKSFLVVFLFSCLVLSD